MIRILTFLGIIIIAAFLTILTQVGGIIYLLSFAFYPFIRKHLVNPYGRAAARALVSVVLYLAVTLAVVPPIARYSGRVPLPLFERNHVRPLTIWTALFNRNYVRSRLRDAVYHVAAEMQGKYPGAVVSYLDAGFPFFNNFPLIPHLSHHDGKKLDIAFYYREKGSNAFSREVPSAIGYGASEPPRKGEPDRPALCASQGYWQYGAIARIMPLSEHLVFDEARTKYMTELFASHNSIAKILIEPHLRQRLKLTSSKMRLHGCHAVRHDDHIHVQLY